MPVKKVAVLCVRGERFGGLEDETARRLMGHLIRRGKGNQADFFDLDHSPSVKEVAACGEYDVYVLIKGIVFITLESINRLSEIILDNRDIAVVAPVCNESAVREQVHIPPFLYQTVSVFDWAVQEVFREYKYKTKEVNGLDDFCVVFRKDVLDVLPGDQDPCDPNAATKKSGLRLCVAPGIYAHRYGDIFESGRADLMSYVPLDAKEILDIGSARGLFGELLKKRQKCSVTGVDIDEDLRKIAATRLDNVIGGDIEELLDRGALGQYDCAICGDVLEHLNNPWKVVKAVKNHLRKGGLFIASTPNVMNWAVIMEQLKGRWDYVPASILSGTHIRFFTRRCLEELFIDAGYEIKETSLQSFELPPGGREFIEGLKRLGLDLNEEELRASEIVVVAAAA